jgi:hypothetical protein
MLERKPHRPRQQIVSPCGKDQRKNRRDNTLDQLARRATLRPHHTPGQPNRSGVEGRRFDRIVHSRTSWQKPAGSTTTQLAALDEAVFLSRRRHPETNRWFDGFTKQRGSAMWDIIINLIYEQSCESYLAEAKSVQD